MKRWLTNGAKLAVSVGLIAYVLSRVDLGAVLVRVTALPVGVVALAFLCLLIQIPLAGWRWWRLSAILGYDLPLGRVVSFLHVGLFFNQVLPSGVGGDVLRIWLLRRHAASVMAAVTCVLLDRLVGVAALVILVACGLPALYATAADPVARLSVAVLVGLAVLGYGALLLLGGDVGRFLAAFRLLAPIRAIASATRSLVVPALGPVLAVSVALHGLTVLAAWLLAGGLGLEVGFMTLAALVPPVFLLLVLPVSMAGWGVREGALVVSLGFAGVAPADSVALSLLLGFGMLAASLPGGLVWLALGRVRPEAG
ncbi:MAG: flippase-like domain-containing protein [Magnetospirillum sp.]|nr:flippase-like domain-containing protein [Magnetospirillum sp.]